MSKTPNDSVEGTAFNQAAPLAERTEALGIMQKSFAPKGIRDLIMPPDELAPVIDFITQRMEDDAVNKSLNYGNIIPFPSRNAATHARGMQSVQLDEYQVSVQGDFWERPSLLNFESLRAMVDQTPVLNAVIMTRQRQISRFCRVQESGEGPGFTVRHVDKEHQVTDTEQESIKLLNRFVTNCGWEFNARERKRLKRDNFSAFMAKLTRDTLTFDAMAIETEMKRDKKLGIDGLYAVDGGTIRLCVEAGYQGRDEITSLQFVNGKIRALYTFDDLIYEVRNPRTDVRACGYGYSETEVLIRVVTGFLNAMTYNIKGFDSNAIPRGMLHLRGEYASTDIDAFKRYWNSMVKGINNAWTLPVMVSRDADSAASFESFGEQFNEMYFAKWMSFLTSIICAIYGMSPSEINFDSFSGGNTSSLSGSDTEAKLEDSKDKGLLPLLSFYENTLTDYVLSAFGDKFVFRFTGLDEEDQQARQEMRKLVLTVNEARAQEGFDAMPGPVGDAPLNPSLIALYTQTITQDQGDEPGEKEDFGTPPPDGGQDVAGGQSAQDGQGAPQGSGAPGKGTSGTDASNFSQPGHAPAAQQQGGRQPPEQPDIATGAAGSEGDESGKAAAPTEALDFGKQDDEEEDFGKSFGLNIYTVE
jgi:hypothetical protein